MVIEAIRYKYPWKSKANILLENFRGGGDGGNRSNENT